MSPDDAIEFDYQPPGIRIIDRLRSSEAARSGRRPGSKRQLMAVDPEGRVLAIAFEFETHWHIDIESAALHVVGAKALATEVIRGFWVRTEAEAADWLEFLGKAVTR